MNFKWLGIKGALSSKKKAMRLYVVLRRVVAQWLRVPDSNSFFLVGSKLNIDLSCGVQGYCSKLTIHDITILHEHTVTQQHDS